jgi:hypothetical protein
MEIEADDLGVGGDGLVELVPVEVLFCAGGSGQRGFRLLCRGPLRRVFPARGV